MAEPNEAEMIERIMNSVRKLDHTSLKKLSEFVSSLESARQESALSEEGGERS